MGIGYHELQFLRFAAKHTKFGRVATLGRLRLFLQREEVSVLMGLPAREYKHDNYCDSLLLEHFGATCVDSWDYSDYEGATHKADMNKPLNENTTKYDTVIDSGTLEHIYNAPQALLNISELCNEGGQIIHMSPANNFCGHGFWQLSPELFFSLYSEANGYADTRAFLATEYRTDIWYEVRRPQNGQRANVISFTPVSVYCRTVKTRSCQVPIVQQSDYIHVWQRNDPAQVNETARPMWRDKIRSALRNSSLIDFAFFSYVKFSGKWSFSPRNPHLTVRSVRSLTQ